MLRILHIVPATPFGGAQRLVVDLAAAQRAEGLDAYVHLTNFGEAAVRASRTVEVPVVVPPERLGLLGRLAATRAALRGDGLDIVHLHLPPPWLVLAIPCRRRFALVTHLHVRPAVLEHPPTIRRRTEVALNGIVLSRSDRLISISEWIDASWRTAHPRLKSPSTIIYNGLPTPLQTPLSRACPDAFVIGMASRLSECKGVEEFIDVARRIHRRSPDIRFLIAGDGPMRLIYERRAADAGLRKVLLFEGFVENMPEFWSQLDLAIFTPPLEPFGLRLIEPIANGVPVVAYRNGSGSDEVIDRCRGVLGVPYADADSLTAAVLELRASRESRNRMAREGMADLERHFSLAAMANQIGDVYTDLLSRIENKVKPA